MIDLVEFPPPCHPENSNWYQCVALCKLVGLHYVFFYMCDFLKRYGQNTVKNGRFWLHSHKSYYKQEVKKRRVSQYRPPNICHVYGHWFHCVALCELIWMHCVVFFILDLLERYRQNTAEHTTTCSLLQALIKRGPVEVGCWKLCAKFYHRLSLISYSEFLHLFKVVLCTPPHSHTHTLKDYTLSLHGTQLPPPKTHIHKHTHTHT